MVLCWAAHLELEVTWGKFLHRIIRSRIQARAEREGLLGEMQNGLRKGRSTNDNLFVISHLMEKAQRAGTRGKELFMVFIDLRKVYDGVWREGVWEVLDNMKLGKKLIRVRIKVYQGHCRRVVTVGGGGGGANRMDFMQNTDETKMCLITNTIHTICSRVGDMY